MTLRFALLGHPVAHSLSPAIHNAAFKLRRVDAQYDLWDVPPEELPQALERATRELSGFNITVPHKQAVFDAASDMHEVARQVGAINTVKVEGSRLRGRNTDVYGLQRACADERFEVAGQNILVLGSGGAARASVVAAARGRAKKVTVAARNLSAAKVLSNELHALFGKVCPVEATELTEPAAYKEVSLVLQATSATLKRPGFKANAQTFAQSLPLEQLPSGACVMDLVYKPSETTVMARAQELGLRTANGLGMLLHQGAAAFEWWTGELAPVDYLREILHQAANP